MRYYVEVAVDTYDVADDPERDIRKVLAEYLDLAGAYTLVGVAEIDREEIE